MLEIIQPTENEIIEELEKQFDDLTCMNTGCSNPAKYLCKNPPHGGCSREKVLFYLCEPCVHIKYHCDWCDPHGFNPFYEQIIEIL